MKTGRKCRPLGFWWSGVPRTKPRKTAPMLDLGFSDSPRTVKSTVRKFCCANQTAGRDVFWGKGKTGELPPSPAPSIGPLDFRLVRLAVCLAFRIRNFNDSIKFRWQFKSPRLENYHRAPLRFGLINRGLLLWRALAGLINDKRPREARPTLYPARGLKRL